MKLLMLTLVLVPPSFGARGHVPPAPLATPLHDDTLCLHRSYITEA